MNYNEFLTGKRVVLVGPSGGYQGLGNGALIDDYDVVVRLNWGCPVPVDQRVDLGSRTDVLYKRLLQTVMPTIKDVGEWTRDGVRFVITGDPSYSLPNARYIAPMLRGKVGWEITGNVRDEIIRHTNTSPLMGLMAIVHLLRQPLASLHVMNCDFYAGGYQADYGGKSYRAWRGRPEGEPAAAHDIPKQLKYLYRLALKDSRLTFDAGLHSMAGVAARTDVPGCLAVIPARWASSRFPGKALAPILGKPMILWTCEAVAKAVPNLVVATDDERIEKVVQAAGFKAVQTGDQLTGTDRVAAVAHMMKAPMYLNVQGDEPLTDPESLIRLIQAKVAHPKSVVNAISRLGDDVGPSVVKAAIAQDGRLLYASRAAIPATKTGHAAQWRQMGLYAYTLAELQLFTAPGARTPLEDAEDVEILRFLELGVPVHTVEVPEGGPAVDFPEHVEAVEAIMSALGLQKELVLA